MHMLFKCISAKCVFVFCLSLLFWQLVLHFGTTFDLYLVSLLLSPIRVSLHHTQQNRTKNREHRKEHNTRSTAAAVVSHGFGFGFPFGVDAFQSDRLAKGLKCLFWIWERDLRMRLQGVAAGCCLNLKLKCGN